METTDRSYFELLKTKIVEIMQRSHAGISVNMKDWKGDDIFTFQEELQGKVNEYISEKSFYNHFKTDHEKLPRIDMLNILARYTGYDGWADFKDANRNTIIHINGSIGSNTLFYLLPAFAVVAFLLIWLIIKAGSTATYHFCFVDNVTKEPIISSPVEVELLKEKESPLHLVCDREGCFSYRTNVSKVRFVAKATYYFPDTISRILSRSTRSEIIPLRADNFAMMIHYFSNSQIADWKKRRDQLERIIADSALIYQVFSRDVTGMELYNKDEFIDMLTVPVGSLRNIEIMDILYKSDRITLLKFKQKYR